MFNVSMYILIYKQNKHFHLIPMFKGRQQNMVVFMPDVLLDTTCLLWDLNPSPTC